MKATKSEKRIDKIVEIVICLVLGLGYVGVKYHIKNHKSESVVSVANGPSFNGVVFGANIKDYCWFSWSEDNSSDRRFLDDSGSHKLSYRYASYSPKEVFRKFTEGKIYATWSSKQVYAVELEYSFPRGSTTAGDKKEMEATVEALKKKYGEPTSVPRLGLVEKGDYRCRFEDGDVEIDFHYVSEGMLSQARMELRATSKPLRSLAYEESVAYFNSRQEKDAASVVTGGADAL